LRRSFQGGSKEFYRNETILFNLIAIGLFAIR
jgi:hypothetical protein